MLSYQHAFHAGNHADILKHFVLSFVLDSLNKKEKPYSFFDTHSGSALYDLYDNRSVKTGEAQKGILSLLDKKEAISLNADFSAYLSLIETFTKDGFYPGSPLIECSKMRKQDFLILSELHPQEIENLKKNINHIKNNLQNPPAVQIHKRNGWEMIKALTPPKTKRGGVLIDPSYEESQDYIDAAEAINFVHKKWSSGIILLWYPLLAHRIVLIEKMLSDIKAGVKAENPNTELLQLELIVNDRKAHKEVDLEHNAALNENTPRLYGSGMLVINAPWKLKESAEPIIKALQSIFYR